MIHEDDIKNDLCNLCSNFNGSVLVACNYAVYHNHIFVYKDEEWKKTIIAPNKCLSWLEIAHNGQCFAAVAFDDGNDHYVTYISEDGVAWKETCYFAKTTHPNYRNVTLPPDCAAPCHIINCDGYFVMHYCNNIYVSHDGLDWNIVKKIDEINNDNYIESLHYNGGRFLISTPNSIKASKL
jgi:hypothetical protein